MSDTQATLEALAAAVRRLEAKLAVIEILGRYGRALDELDWDELRTLIAADVVARHDAVAPPLSGLENMFAVIEAVQPRLATVQHFVTNQHVDIDADGESATAHAFIYAMHDTGAAAGTGALLPAGAAYRMACVRADTRHGWQIKEIEVKETWWHPGIKDLFDQSPLHAE